MSNVGYPMSYMRMVNRNNLSGQGYLQQHESEPGRTVAQIAVDSVLSTIRGDLRRLEQDSRDDYHLQMYAERADITVEQAKTLLDAFFERI